MRKYLVLCTLIVLSSACSSESSTNNGSENSDEIAVAKKEGITTINGVERSELALTMRLMYDQMKLASDSLKAGHTIKTDYLKRFQSIHTDIATEPEKIDDIYQGLAANFIEQYQLFEVADTNQVGAFNNMLDACLACHVSKCPGPIKAIKKIKLR